MWYLLFLIFFIVCINKVILVRSIYRNKFFRFCILLFTWLLYQFFKYFPFLFLQRN